jgi:hypothetical protein
MNRRADTGASVNRLKSSGPSGKKDTHHSGWLVVSSASDFMPWIDKHFKSASLSKGPKKYNIEFGIAMIDRIARGVFQADWT